MAAVASARRIRGEGNAAEAEWQDWLAELQPPALAASELLTATQRLVVVSPHPDDEVLACGGLIALHAQRGGSTAIVAVTDGEASHCGDPAWPATKLSGERREERQRGLVRLGIPANSVARLALADSQVAAQRGVLKCGLQRVLRSTDCVVSTWHLDGHPDHDATGAETARVCAEVGCRLVEAPVWMWHWSTPADPRVPWHRLRALALPPWAMGRKAAALAEHVTQLGARAHGAPVLGPAILTRAARTAEYFFL